MLLPNFNRVQPRPENGRRRLRTISIPPAGDVSVSRNPLIALPKRPRTDPTPVEPTPEATAPIANSSEPVSGEKSAGPVMNESLQSGEEQRRGAEPPSHPDSAQPPSPSADPISSRAVKESLKIAPTSRPSKE